jgi:tryptophanyl-tRNA synthetase
VTAQIESKLAPMREHYAQLMANPEQIEEILQEGARKARAVATPFMAELRDAVGLRRMVAVKTPSAASKKATGAALPEFKQYREADGRFFFKLVTPDGQVVVQSGGFDAGREAGRIVQLIKTEGGAALADADVSFPAGREAAEQAIQTWQLAQE